MALIFPSLCHSCAWYHGETLGPDLKVCDAFPDGIPPDVWDGSTSHWDPFADGSDQGVIYEPRPGHEAFMEAYLAFWYDHEDRPGDTPASPTLEPRPR